MATFPTTTHTLRDGTRVRLRNLQPLDAAGAIALRIQNATDSPYLLTEPDEVSRDVGAAAEDYQRSLLAQSEVSMGAFLLGEEDREVALIGLLRCTASKKRRIAHVGNVGISVALAHRGQGLGRIMMDACIAWARVTPPLTKLALEVFAKNTGAYRLYESLGFRHEGVRVRQLMVAPGQYEDDIAMGLWLGDAAGEAR